MKNRLRALVVVALAAGLFVLVDGRQEATDVVAQSALASCPVTAPSTTQSGTILQAFASSPPTGVVYDTGTSALTLPKETANFFPTPFSAFGTPEYACAADFDGDGWTDFVGSKNGKKIAFYQNLTTDNQVTPPPRWSDPTYHTVPKFEVPSNAAFYNAGTTCVGAGVMGCGDFNGDGLQDFVYIQQAGNDGTPPCFANIFLGKDDGFGHPTGTFDPPYQLTNNLGGTALDAFRDMRWDGNLVVTDYNGDGRQDFLFGAEDPVLVDRGFVQVFLNDGGAGHTANPLRPTFAPGPVIASNIDVGTSGVSGMAYADVTGDGLADLAVTGSLGPSSNNIFVYPGLPGGGVDPVALRVNNSQQGGQILVATDFSGDGKNDLMMGTNAFFGTLLYWQNDGLANPFGHSRDVQISPSPAFPSFDLGIAFDYDHDPNHTLDLLLGDKNSNTYAVVANRLAAGPSGVGKYVGCSDVESGVLDLGALATTEMVVIGGKLTPTISLPAGTTASYFMSNETPAVWSPAAPCVGDPTSYCVSFPAPTGRDVRWKARLCSDTPAGTFTPSLSSMDVTFDYTPAAEHYRAGVVVDDGVAYVGAFRQPGDEGHLYALSASLGTTYWDFATFLNNPTSDASRVMYTTDLLGTTRLDFSVANAGDPSLQATLLGVGGVTAVADASAVIAWQRSPRFGTSGSARLGSIENATPAILRPPGLPVWYPRASPALRTLVETFRTANATRPTLALVGSKDGALHAIHSLPTTIADSKNGTEAWAFVPLRVARGLLADMSAGTTTVFPDGSPTLADVVFADNTMHTVAIVGGGAGYTGFFALDVTNTVSATGTIIGPTPLWETIPGGTNAGLARSKAAIARVSIAGVDHFIAIMATGIAPSNPVPPYTKGRDVVAVDVETGAALWSFKSECPVTSNIVVFETDDALEPGSPTFDGYIDRAVWADVCGNVYKVDPAQATGGNYIAGMGGILTGSNDPAGAPIKAIFSTAATACAIGGERPIVGTIGARSDPSGRLALFFGTGGLESFTPALNNAFYAVYADTGEIRGCAASTPSQGRVLGTCTAGLCEKFYGGVVVSASNVIITRSTDAPIATGTCEFGTSAVTGFSITDFSVAFSVATASATVGSIYGDGGAVYVTTLAGDVVKLGTPRVAGAGGDTSGGTGGGQAQVGDGGGGGKGMGILGWRIVQ